MPDAPPQPTTERVLHEVAKHLNNLRLGSIEILVHNGQVVAIERRERTRLAPPPKGGPESH
jgi:hypothetical protein